MVGLFLVNTIFQDHIWWTWFHMIFWKRFVLKIKATSCFMMVKWRCITGLYLKDLISWNFLLLKSPVGPGFIKNFIIWPYMVELILAFIQALGQSTIMFIILWNFLMMEKNFLSSHVKQSVMISNILVYTNFHTSC